MQELMQFEMNVKMCHDNITKTSFVSLHPFYLGSRNQTLDLIVTYVRMTWSQHTFSRSSLIDMQKEINISWKILE